MLKAAGGDSTTGEADAVKYTIFETGKDGASDSFSDARRAASNHYFKHRPDAKSGQSLKITVFENDSVKLELPEPKKETKAKVLSSSS